MRLGEMYCWVSRMREICQSGLKRGEAAIAPPLLYWSKIFTYRKLISTSLKVMIAFGVSGLSSSRVAPNLTW